MTVELGSNVQYLYHRRNNTVELIEFNDFSDIL